MSSLFHFLEITEDSGGSYVIYLLENLDVELKKQLYYTHFLFLKELQHNGVENKEDVKSKVQFYQTTTR